jgi:hypothetical protein
LYDQVNEFLQSQADKTKGKVTREVLFSLADQMISTRGSPKIDRLASRKKEGLMCWFCENISALVSILRMQGVDMGPNGQLLGRTPRAAEQARVEPEAPLCPDLPEPELTWGTVTSYDFFDWSRW